MPPPLIVLDTSVVARATLGSSDAASVAVVDAVETGIVRLAISDDYLDELARTMSKSYLEKNASVGRAFRIALTLAYMGIFRRPIRHEWPTVTDRADWWLLDLAFDSGVDSIVTWDERHLGPARSLGFEVLNPGELMEVLRRQYGP